MRTILLLARDHRLGFGRLLILWALFAAFAVSVQAMEGRVIKVVDGDTLDIVTATKERYRVRIGGIDAPESGQPYGRISTRHLRSLALRRPVTIKVYKHDVHGRTVGEVWVAPYATCPENQASCERTRDLGLEQIKVGLAWHYKHYAEEQGAPTRLRYSDAEQRARAQRAGLWASRHPVAPWEWRHGGHTKHGR